MMSRIAFSYFVVYLNREKVVREAEENPGNKIGARV